MVYRIVSRLLAPTRFGLAPFAGCCLPPLVIGCGPPVATQIREAANQLETLHQTEQEQQLTCQFGPRPTPDEVRERSLAEWDAAAGDSVANISPDQEWEIRKALGREMGLAPSEVNGWRDIYARRANDARRTLARLSDAEAAKQAHDRAAQRQGCEQLRVTRSMIAGEQELRDHLARK